MRVQLEPTYDIYETFKFKICISSINKQDVKTRYKKL